MDYKFSIYSQIKKTMFKLFQYSKTLSHSFNSTAVFSSRNKVNPLTSSTDSAHPMVEMSSKKYYESYLKLYHESKRLLETSHLELAYQTANEAFNHLTEVEGMSPFLAKDFIKIQNLLDAIDERKAKSSVSSSL